MRVHFLGIDAVIRESPSSGRLKNKSDVDVVFAAMPTPRCRLRINSVYTFYKSFHSSVFLSLNGF